MKLKEIPKEKFITYAMERMERNRNNNDYCYKYLNKARFELIYDWLVKHKLECKGRSCYQTIDGKFESQINSPLPTQEELPELTVEELLHTAFCKTEWCCRCATIDTWAKDTVENYFGKKFIKQILEVA